MARSLTECFLCGKLHEKRNGDINRARKLGNPLFCSKDCMHELYHFEARLKSDDQKKAEKYAYDKEYRVKNKDKIKKRKDAYNKTEAGRAAQKRNRSKRIKQHNEYCRQPEYRKYKHKYDVVFRAQNNYGEFWQCAVLVNQIEKEILKWIPKNERLYYLNNVRNQTIKKNKQRLQEAIKKIESGQAGSEILQGPWIESSKKLLSDLLIK